MGVSILATLAGIAVPMLLTAKDAMQLEGAARYLAAEAMLARSRAAKHGTAVGMRFQRDSRDGRSSDEDGWTMYVDGDGDGIRSADVAQNADRPLGPHRRLQDSYPTVRFGIGPSVPLVGSSRPAGSGSDPIRLGQGETLTFSALGTSTSGTIYLRSRSGRQYALRVLGVTGRIRLLRFDPEAARWRDR